MTAQLPDLRLEEKEVIFRLRQRGIAVSVISIADLNGVDREDVENAMEYRAEEYIKEELRMTENEKKLTDALVAIEIHLKDATSKLIEARYRGTTTRDLIYQSALNGVDFAHTLATKALED